MQDWKTMKRLLSTLAILCAVIAASASADWQPNIDSKLELSIAQAMLEAKEKDPSLEKWFEAAYAYAVFPQVGKGGVGVGAAHGSGVVIHGDRVVGDTKLSQVTVGLQLGGQVYSQFIFFRDKTAFDHFSRGNFEFGAQVSSVALTAGASKDANYDGGVAVFTNPRGGLMAEASVGGQKFEYTPR